MSDRPTAGAPRGAVPPETARPATAGTVAPRREADRESAAVRSAAYALFSQLVGSPSRQRGTEDLLPPADLAAVAAGLGEHLPYRLDLAGLVAAAEELGEAASERLAGAYSRLFEVGSEGPPVALREELAADRPSRAKEEVVRYYDYFGYRLLEELRWAPDHLGIELEFLHFLAFREATAAAEEGAEWRSYRLAALDFLERHPLDWIGEVRAGVAEHAEEPYHRELFDALSRFLEGDRDWLAARAEREV